MWRHRGKPWIGILTTLLIFGALLATTVFAQEQGYQGSFPKYVFFFIGDGMGINHIHATELYKGVVLEGKETPSKLTFTSFPIVGLNTTYAADTLITDSASAITAIATGHKTNDGVLNMDPSLSQKLTTFAELAKQEGWKVAVLSSVSLDHATPAGFYAHNKSRNNYYDIALEMGESNFDFFAGGGLRQPKGKEKDKRDALEIIAEKGYQVVTIASREDLAKVTPGQKALLINGVLDEDAAMPYEIDRAAEDLSLADYTRKAIEMLQGQDRFFIFVEGGKIDWASHANDAKAVIYDVLAFDEAIKEAVKFYKQHPNDTLIVVTSDHDNGGMSLGQALTRYELYLEVLKQQKGSYLAFDQLVRKYRENTPGEKASFEDFFPTIGDFYGLLLISEEERNALNEKAKTGDKEAAMKLHMSLTPREEKILREAFSESMKKKDERAKGEEAYLAYGGYEPVTMACSHILNAKAGIGWTTYSHLATPTLVFSIGAGSELFGGYFDNTDFFTKFTMVMNLELIAMPATKEPAKP